eukprot:366467-Chlamydomonas_euryale.AAC.16
MRRPRALPPAAHMRAPGGMHAARPAGRPYPPLPPPSLPPPRLPPLPQHRVAVARRHGLGHDPASLSAQQWGCPAPLRRAQSLSQAVPQGCPSRRCARPCIHGRCPDPALPPRTQKLGGGVRPARALRDAAVSADKTLEDPWQCDSQGSWDLRVRTTAHPGVAGLQLQISTFTTRREIRRAPCAASRADQHRAVRPESLALQTWQIVPTCACADR